MLALQSCGCCSLRTGCIIIAAAQLLYSIPCIALGFYMVATYGIQHHNSYSTLASGIFVFALAAWLIYGIRTGRPQLFRTWFIVVAVWVAAQVVLLIICVILIFAPDAFSPDDSGRILSPKKARDREFMNDLKNNTHFYVPGLIVDIIFDLCAMLAVYSYRMELLAASAVHQQPVGYHAPSAYVSGVSDGKEQAQFLPRN